MSKELVTKLGLSEADVAAHELDYAGYLKEIGLEAWLAEIEMAYAYRDHARF